MPRVSDHRQNKRHYAGGLWYRVPSGRWRVEGFLLNGSGSDLQAIKRALRKEFRRRRKGAHASGSSQAALRLRDVVLRQCLPWFEAARVVAGYNPQGSEISPLLLMGALQGQGRRLCLPCVNKKTGILVFRAYRLGDELFLSRESTVPEPFPESAVCEPDILFVPLVGFDRSGARLGQGGGCFDRTLKALKSCRPIMAVGLAYSVQEVDSLPQEDHDARLDAIATEKEWILCS